jgi:LysM repeat protein
MRLISTLFIGAMLIAPATASADFPHVVSPGESLSSVAAVDGLSVGQLAAANGLPADALLIAGSTLMIPPPGTAAATGVSPTAGGGEGDGDADSDDGVVESAPASSQSMTTGSSGSYIVQPGDTLSGIAARAGMTTAQLASLNGLDPNGVLLAGSIMRLGGASSSQAASPASGVTLPVTSSAAVSQPVGVSAEGSPSAPPYPTPERVSASEVGTIAAENGVPPSLAQAIGWQESGFNNNLVSSADARGVMQILPGTWNWIGRTLAPPGSLAPASAASNVRAGAMLLRSLLTATGGNEPEAVAGYFQGLPSVRQNGMFPSTRQYVNDVMALQRRFAGG